MSPDRYGNPDERKCSDPRCGNGRPKGWVGEDDEGRPIPCLQCKDHLLKGTSTVRDFAEIPPSGDAQDAINRADGR